MLMNLLTKVMSMKNIHGKLILIFFILLTLSLEAKESKYCTYSIESKKSDVKVNEAVNINFTTRQKIHNEVIFFDLTPQKSDDYEIVNINEKRHEFNYHDAKKDFEFLLLPKKSGKIVVKFDFQIRRASDDAVKQAYVGSRDNVKSIPTIKVHIDTPTIVLNVQKLHKNTQAVGDFNINMSLDTTKSDSYDAVNVVYTLQGKGFLYADFEPLQDIKGVSIFKGIKEIPLRVTKDGYVYQKEWSYALVSDNDIIIPTVTLNTYSYRAKRYIKKGTPSKTITVTKLNIDNLVDDTEAPNSELSFKKYIEFFYNFLIFIAGFIVAKLLVYLPKKVKQNEECCALIIEAKDAKNILKYSLKYVNRVEISKEIEELEELIYKGKSNRSLYKIKAAIIQKIKRVK